MRMITLAGLMIPPIPTQFSLIGILSSGQSLSVGDYGYPPIDTSPFGSNVQLLDSSGNYTTPSANTWSLVPLIAPVRADKYSGGGGITAQYPDNIGGESPDVATANTIAYLASLDSKNWAVSTSNCGQGGASYTEIEKDGTQNAYQSLLNEVTVFARLVSGYGAGISLLTHGEADAALSPGVYGSFLSSYRADINADISAITGQFQNIPLVISQQNAFPNYTGVSLNWNQSGLDQVQSALDGVCILACPKYQYPYFGDMAHLVALGYQMLGEKYGQVCYSLLSGNGWTSFLPVSASLSGNNVTVTFAAPVLPLQWNTNLSWYGSAIPNNHSTGAYSAWANGNGFEAWSGGVGGTIVTISSVSIQNGNQVLIECTSTPDTIGYAHSSDISVNNDDPLYRGGFLYGGYGQSFVAEYGGNYGSLQDSDPFVGYFSGNAQPNFCPEFSINL
jgi:hypothetical protein